jgi:PhoH-like ATPase
MESPASTTLTKTFILDTNVLIHDPNALWLFEENTVIIPLDVLEELDNKKKADGAVGRAARAAIRNLEELRLAGDLGEGVTANDSGGLVKVLSYENVSKGREPDLAFMPPAYDEKVDNRLLLLQYWLLFDLESPAPVILVTKDINLRVKAGVHGLVAEDYLSDKVSVHDLYTGTRYIKVEKELINYLYSEKELAIDEDEDEMGLFPNELVCLEAIEDSKQTALAIAKVNERGETYLRLIPDRKHLMGSKGARNREQQMALELLLDPGIPLVTINGSLGTGKTFIALLGALHAVLDLKLYDQILISRKFVHHSVKEGFLPGDIEEKSEPWMKPFFSCLDAILGGKQDSGAFFGNSRNSVPIKPHEYLIERGFIQQEHLAYIRGVTYNNKFILIDEAASLTPEEAKTIIGRAGDDTKVVLLGDIDQIDDPYLDASSNGLTYAIDCWKDEPLAGHITLIKGERSPLSQRASTIM